MKKRIISLLLCLVMVVGLLPVTAYADIEQENMNTYAGKRITKIELKASVNTEIYPTTNTDSYAVSREITVGDPVENSAGKNTAKRIKFEITGMTWKQGDTTETITGEEATTILWISVNALRWMTGAVSYWEWVKSDDHYLACKYNYMISVDVRKSKLGGADTEQENNGYRIDPNVVVTVAWDGSGRAAESCSVNVYNSHDVKYGIISSSINATTADFTISGDGALKLSPAGVSIPAGFGSEAIKPISLALWASGGTKPYTFSKVSGPTWINVSTEGKITGTPPAEFAAADTLTVKVTDANGDSVTANISVGAMKAARTVIKSIEIAGLDYPRVGDVIPHVPNVYITKIVAADGSVISQGACPLYLNRPQWEDQNGNIVYNTGRTFEVGEKYQFSVQVRLEGADNCEKYYLAKDFTAIVPRFVGGEPGNNTLTANSTSYLSGENYACLFVDSPMWEAVDTGHTLTGDVTYSGAARYGQKLTANVSDLPTEVAESDLSYQWQRKHNNLDIWYDIDGATDKQLTLNDDDLIDRQIRVTVRCTGTNYAGTIFGAPITVGKNWNMGTPVRPVIEYKVGGESTPSRLEISADSFKGGESEKVQEYIWTSAPPTGENGYAVWPADDDTIVVQKASTTSIMPSPEVVAGGSVSLAPGQTYYVYTRFKETDTQEAGRILEAASFTVPFADGSGSGGESGEPTIGATDMVYPDYDSKTPTIYLKKGDSITVKYQLDPNDANSNLPQWKGAYDIIGTSGKTGDVTVTHNKDNKTITIQAPADGAVGEAYVVAYKDASATSPERWYGSSHDSTDGRQITVIIYDPTDPANVPFAKAYLGMTELYKGDSYEITKADLRDLPFVPSGVSKDNYTLAAKFTTYGTGGSSGTTTRSDTNDYVSLSSDEEKFVITGKDATLSGSSVYVEFFALPNDTEVDEAVYGKYAIAALSVTVKERPVQPDRTATVSPNTLSLLANETYQLQAYMTPTSTETVDTFTWSSSDESVATVDENGKVTAVADGTATITATCGEGDAAVSAACVITVKADCTDHAYKYLESGWGHVKVCDLCGDSDGEILDHNMSWQESTENPGKMYGECIDCGYKTDLIEIPSNEAPTDPTPSTPNKPNIPNLPDSSSGGHHSGAGRPYRPDLSAAVPEGTTTAAVQSPKTGDAGIMLYAALSLMSMTGGAWLVSKKRRDR